MNVVFTRNRIWHGSKQWGNYAAVLHLLIFREGGRAFGDCFATLDSKPKTMDGQIVSALCVNLGHGSGHKVDGGETARAHQVAQVI